MAKRLSFNQLVARVKRRARTNKRSRTSQLIRRGRQQIAKKIIEEGGELAIAGMQQQRRHVIAETADLLYAVAVLLHVRNIPIRIVESELGKRAQRTKNAPPPKGRKRQKKSPRTRAKKQNPRRRNGT